MPEEIQRRLIEDEMKENYVDYAMSVIVSRALPDARDGLKPVHRRILFIMNQLGLQRNKPFRKSATVVGNVMAKLHPHGDSAIYETMVRMAQPFSLRYMLVDGQGNFGCFTKDTKIALTDGRNLSFGELVEEHKKGKKNYTYTINKNGNVEIAEIKNPRLTKKDQKIMKVILDNDEEIKCTLNHKFMLRDEIYNEAQYLKPKISLMPLYLRLSTKKDKLKPSLKGYKMVYQPKTNNWVPCHNLADAWNLKNNVYNKNAGRIRYHVDFNKFNNNPDNLRRIKWEDHWKLHAKHASKLHENEDYRKKIAAGRTKYWLEPENKKVHSRMLSERNKKNWMNPDYREKMCRLLSKVNKEYIKKHPEKRKEFSRRATQTLKKLWKNPIYRLKKSEALKEKWKNLEYRKEQSMRMKGLSDSLWSKQGHREHMSRLAKERWVNDKAFRDYFLNIFSQNGKKSNYNRFLKVCRKTFGLYNGINGKNYEKVRVSYNSRKGAGIIKFDTGLKKFFNNNLESLYQELASTKMNHKVEEIIFLDKREDVYDITIEGTHNFALASGVFVHNSVDGDSAAAMRYCVTGDTLISTNKGVIPIITISNKKEDKINLKILSYDGKKNNAIKFFNSGKHKIIGIETEQGYSIKGSYNHPVLCWTKGFLGKPKLEWKLLESINEGDILILQRNFAMFSDKRLEFKKFYPKYNHRFKKISLPNYMDADIAFLLGALVSEGSFHQNKIIFNNSDMEFYGKVKKIILNKFKGTKLYERNIQGNCKELELYPQKAVKFLENIGLKNKKSKEKRIPFSVLNSKKEHIASFLKGLFEGDGSVIFKIDKRHKGKSIELAYHSKSIDLIKELKIILLSFGIVTTKPYKDKRFNCYKLQISGYESIFRFYTEIGFFSKRKQNELSKIKKLKSTRMSKTDFIPHLANYMRDKYPSQFLRKNNFDRYNLLIKNYNKLKIIIDDEDKILIDNIINFNYFFNAVKKIRKYKEETVYSIKVDSNCHSFVGNCFINHNTEARMQKITEELLADIEKDTVDFIPNYDGSAEEPTVLPAKVPNLLVNGSSGIAVGMATNMAPHNMNEICDAIISTVDNPEIEVSELLKIVPGPDFPTGGFICGRKGIVDAYNTGRGRLVMRAKTNVEENGDKKRIIVTEIPYQVNKASMIETIANNVRDKKIEGIRDIRDESDRVGMRVVFDLKKGFDPNVVLNQLYHNSQLQTTFGINNIALIGGQPKVMNLKDLIGHYIDHRKDILTRRTKFDLKKAEEKAHILEGLKIALGSIDSVIKTIKSSKDVNEAKKQLMSKFKLSDKQSQAILEMRLQKLTSLETGKINSDYDDTIKLITELKGILDSEEKIKDMIKSDLKGLKENFGDDRRTEILEEEDEIELEDMIPQEDVVVTVTHSGYIKKLPVTTYKKQKRGGKGVKGTGVKEEDAVEHLFTTSNHNYILFFTNKGKVHWLKAYQIPTASRYSRGKAIINLLFLGKEERVTALVPIQKFDENHFLLMATKKGLVKKTALSEFSRPRRGGIAAIKLKEGDELVKVLLTPGTLNIIVATKKGMAVKFNEKDVSAIGRTGMGVKGIKLKNRGDEVVGMEVALDAGTLLTVTENGFGKRTDMDEYTLIRRGGSGVINIKTTERNGDVVGVKTVQDSDEILIITKLGQMIRVNVKDISKIGRATQGVRVMRLDSGDKVTTIARVVAKSEE